MWKILPKLLLGSLLTALVMVLTLSLASVSSAHSCKPGCTPIPTPTATPRPTPAVQACQVTEIIFLERFEDPSVVREAYRAGETIRVRVKVADYDSQPLVGAQVILFGMLWKQHMKRQAEITAHRLAEREERERQREAVLQRGREEAERERARQAGEPAEDPPPPAPSG